MHRVFARFYFKASQLQVIKTAAPKARIPDEQLVFGKSFTDHMLTVEWKSNTGWSSPVIKPFENLNLSPASSVLHYATECFEGMKAYRTTKNPAQLCMFRPTMNMTRLNLSSGRLSLPEFNESEILKCIQNLVKLDAPWIPSGRGYSLYIRPVLIATTESISVCAPDRALLFVICSPVGPYFSNGFKAIKLLAEEKNVRAWPGGTGAFKVGANYAPTIALQKAAIERGYNQNLWLLGSDHEITEFGSMNCFILLKDASGAVELVTPPLTNGTILPGVMRDSILKLAKQIPEISIISERKITMSELTGAHAEGRLLEMFGSGTAAIVAPIKGVHFQGRDYEIPLDEAKQAGSITQRLNQLITQIQYGEIDHEWCVKF